MSAEHTWAGWPPPAPHGDSTAATFRQVNGKILAAGGSTPTPPAGSAAPVASRPDDTVVRSLHEQAAGLLAAEFRNAPDVGVDDRRAIGEDIAARVVRQYVDTRRVAGDRVDDSDEQTLLDAVLAYLFGLGRLQAVTDDPDVVMRLREVPQSCSAKFPT